MNIDTLQRAIQLQQAGDLPGAETLYRQVLQADPRDLNALFRLAVVCQIQGRAAEATPLYQQLLTLQPGSVQALNNLGLTLATLDRLDEALTACQEAVRLRSDCAEFHNNLGTVLNTMGRLDQAAEAFRRALTLDARYLAAWRNQGMLQLKLAEAKRIPTTPHPRRPDDAHLDEAVHCLRAAFTLQPMNPMIANSLGIALFSLGQTAEAGDCFQRALTLRPDDADTGLHLARVWTSLKKWPEAVSCLRHVIGYHPTDVRALSALGEIYAYHLPNPAEALQYYQRAAAVAPHDAKIRLMIEALSETSTLAQLPAEHMIREYDAWAEGWDDVVKERGDRSQVWLREALEPAQTQLDILDLGCGTGLCGAPFRPWARTLVGVDQSAGMLAQARARGIYDELIESDLTAAVQRHAERFDLIVASDVLLLIGDLGPLFHGVARVLRPGGRFAFTVDLLDGEGDYRLSIWLHYAHSRAYVARLAHEVALEIVSVRDVINPRDNGGSAAGLVVVLRKGA